MKRRLKMRERRSLRRYYETFGGTLNLAALAYRFTSAVLPLLVVIGLAGFAQHLAAHTASLSFTHPHGLLLAASAVAVPVMNQKSKELRQQRSKLIEEMHDLTEKTSFDDEAQKRWKAKDAEQKALKAQIDAIEATSELRTEMEKVQAPPLAQPGAAAAALSEAEQRVLENPAEKMAKELRAKLEGPDYKNAFFEYVRWGDRGMSQAASRTLETINRELRSYTGMNVGTGSQGGYTVPIGFQRELEIKMKAYGRMRANARLVNTSTGNTLDWPTMDDTANSGHWVAENAAVSQTNPSFGQIQFFAYLGSSDQVLVSVQLLQDSAFDMEAELADAFGIRLGRLTNAGYTTGTGSTQPTGLVYGIQNDTSPNIVNAIGSNSNDGITGNTEANSVGSDDLDNLVAAVDPSYRQDGMYMMHWKTIDFLRKLKDKYGRPLWTAGLAEKEPDRIWGYPFDWNADMDQIGAGKYPIVFGAIKTKYIIRDVAGFTMVRYNELYMPNHQVGFQAFLRTDGNRIQPAAFSLLYNPLS